MADFQEVADQFRAMIDEVRVNPAQIIDPNSVEFAKAIAMHSAERVTSQKKFAKSVGEEFIIAKQLTLLDRKRTLDAQLRGGITGNARDAADFELQTVEGLLDRNKDLLDLVNQQVGDWGEAVGQVAQLDEFERKRLEIQLEAQENLSERVSMTEQEVALADERLVQLADEDKILKVMQTRRREMAAQQQLRNKQEEVFGISTDKINSKVDEMGNLLSTTAGRITVIASALKVVLTPVITQMIALRDTGLTWSQTMTTGLNSLRAMKEIGGFRGIFTAKETLEGSLALASSFADLTFQTSGMVANVSEMQTVFKLSAGEAAELAEVLTKVGGLTAHGQESMMETAKAFGTINKINPGALLQAAARHAGVFARFGEKGAQAFFRSVTAAERLGIELSSIESSADKFLDIDEFFQDVSRLRTLGINISDPFGLAQIAETGTPEQIMDELTRQLENINLEKLTRTQRNALSSTVGMDFAEISRLITGGGPEGAAGRGDGIQTASEAQIHALGSLTAGVGNATDAILSLIGMFGGLSGVMSTLVTVMAAQAVLTGGKGLISGLLGRLGIGAAAGGAGAAGAGAAATGGAAAAGGAGIAAMAGTAAVGLAAGLGIGELINRVTGMRSIGDMMATRAEIKEFEQRGAEADRQTAILRAQNAPLREAIERGADSAELDRIRTQIRTGETTGAVATPAADATTATTGTPELATREQMQELIGFFRRGFVVNIDGRKAGRMMAVAQGSAF